MALTVSLLQLPPLHSLKLSNPHTIKASSFFHGSTPLSLISKPSSSFTHQTQSPPSFLPLIRAVKSLQGRVITNVNDKTVSVEVVRLAPHPKYKRRVRKKKKYQAHDPDNQFQVGDVVQLESCKPISKTKHFLAVPVPSRNSNKKKSEDETPQELGIALESQQLQA